MTDKFTLEEIEANFVSLWESEGADNLDAYYAFERLKEKLTKPRVEFAEGEVGFDPVCNDFFVVTADDLAQNKGIDECRKLTTTEAGAGELVEVVERAVRRLIGIQIGNSFGSDIANQDIANQLSASIEKWKGDRDE